MEGRERAKTVFKKIKNDYTFRTFALSSLSLLITAAYTVYNVFLAIFYKSAWNMGIAVYYVIPISIKAFVITEELKFLKTKASEEKKTRKKKKILLGSQLAAVFCRPCFNRPRFHDGAAAKRNRLYRNTRNCHGGIHNLQNRIFRQKFC